MTEFDMQKAKEAFLILDDALSNKTKMSQLGAEFLDAYLTGLCMLKRCS